MRHKYVSKKLGQLIHRGKKKKKKKKKQRRSKKQKTKANVKKRIEKLFA